MKIKRQNFVIDFNLFSSKDIAIKKNASATVENFEKLKRLADFYLKKRRVSITNCFYYY